MDDVKKEIEKMFTGFEASRREVHKKARGFSWYQLQMRLENNKRANWEVDKFPRLKDAHTYVFREYARNTEAYNKRLKQGMPLETQGERSPAHRLQFLLSCLPNSPEISYRGTNVPFGSWDNINPGDTVANNTFMSKSLDINVPKEFACTEIPEELAPKEEKVFFRIHGRTGKNVSLFAIDPDDRAGQKKEESEILFGLGTLFNVLAIRKEGDTYYVLLNEKIEPPREFRRLFG